MTDKSDTARPVDRSDMRRAVMRSPVSQALAVLLISAVVIAAGEITLETEYDLAMVDSVEIVRSAHALARTAAAESGDVVRMQVMAEDGQVRVWRDATEARGMEELLDVSFSSRTWIQSDVSMICFDGGGRPLLAQGCEQQIGTISVGTRRGGETWLTLTPDGQLVWSGSTIAD